MKKAWALLLIIAIYGNLYAQYVCNSSTHNVENTRAICSRVTPTNSYDMNLLIQSYIPNNVSPVITIPVNINVWRKDDGTGNWWQDTPAFRDSLQLAFDYLNIMYSQNVPYTLNIPNTQFIVDTKVRFIIDTVYYYNNTEMAYKKTPSPFAEFLLAHYPERLNHFNYHLSIDSAANYSGYSSGYDYQYPSIVSVHQNNSQSLYVFAQHMAHEFGHNFGLGHTYNSETYIISDPEFLWDVFGTETQTWCTAPPTEVCFHEGGWDCVISDPSTTCTNNIMGGTKESRHFSALQCGRIRRALHVSSLRKFAYGETTPPDLHICNNKLIDHTIRHYQTIIIDSGATLTITCRLEMSPGTRIIVRPGGKLIVDGGTLTSACSNEMWQGIEVVGDRTKRQLPQYQGTVELKNGAVIENALCGIRTGLREDTITFATTGGIVKADSSYFVNNRCAVEMNSYTNRLPNGSPTSNVSHFYNCSFEVDNNNLFAANSCSFRDHVVLWEVWNIKIKGCSFSNSTNEQNDRRHAIYIHDAGLTLDTYCNSEMSIPEGCECPDINSTYNEFSGFSTAVEVNTSGGQHSVEINSARFTNNEVGICINGNHYATITRNRFDMTAPTFRYVSGLVLNNCTGYKVEGNSYKGVVNYVNGITTGILVNNNNSSQNIIYRDTFNTLTYGLEFLSNNRGVQAQCNTFDGDGTDIYVCRMSTMSSSQGSLQISAGNMFNHIYGFNIQNKGFSNIDYYYSGTPASNNIYYPTIYSSNVTLLSSNLANPCTPTLCNNNNNNPRLAGFSGMMDSYTAALDSIGANDDSPLQGENLPLTDMARNLSEIYYAAVRSILSDTVLDLNALEQWHSAAQPIADPYSLTETRFAMGYSEPFVADADDAELANYAEFHAMKLALRNNDGSVGNINWYALTDAQIAQLQTIAERNTGRASEMAKGVLCFFFGICYDNDLMVDDNADNHDNHSDAETRSAKTAQQDGETNLNVYPNPSDDILYVELSGAGIANITLYDLQGRAVGANNDSPLQGIATLNVRNVPAGVYVLRVTDVNGKEYHRKVVVD
jgi:hypothetical protein